MNKEELLALKETFFLVTAYDVKKLFVVEINDASFSPTLKGKYYENSFQ
jgi:hypothetical protein